LHIGGARTALFNWAFARHHGGKMLLRIEDTDRKRSTEDAVAAIFAGLKWLGLDWDGEPVFQHTRIDYHISVANELLERGLAYKCYCTASELQDMRDRASAAGLPPRYDGTCRNGPPADKPADAPFAVRFKAPVGGATVIDDQVQGTVTIAHEQLDDLVILRSDGTPTYMLSVVADDHDMGITHVIRGDDHVTNTARQIQIYKALGWDLPVFAHIPLIHGADGAKLSKRHGALSVTAYRDLGYLPEAMRNYLARLGWSHGDDEVFSTEQLVEWFDLGAIGRAPARFDFAKLESLNAHYMRAMDDSRLLDEMLALLPDIDFAKDWPADPGPELRQRLLLAMPALKQRAKTLVELANVAAFLFANRPLRIDDRAATLLDAEARVLLGRLAAALGTVGSWKREELEASLRDFCADQEVKLGKVAQPLRAALTGTTVSPGIFDVLWVLGCDEAIARIQDQAAA